ncbi:hypothetical protein [Flaviflagellibacter deserti]|jgi:hypothetical protein|uniref:Uncharacterized protein n=1 Tax=Flaviflagellibacter deserti TaxID=2267266 RepID=A0ABV9Z5C1_9HYPH
MVFSVQQIKFEFLMYIKEFGGRAEDWQVGTCSDPRAAMFESGKVDESADIWLWKPAMTPQAAAMIYRFMTQQFRVNPAPFSVSGPDCACVFLYKVRDEQTIAS